MATKRTKPHADEPTERPLTPEFVYSRRPIERIRMVKEGVPADFLVCLAKARKIPRQRLYEPVGTVSPDWGYAWATSVTSLRAEVPSVIVPEESNVLINPRHPGSARVAATKVRRWTYGARFRTNPR